MPNNLDRLQNKLYSLLKPVEPMSLKNYAEKYIFISEGSATGRMSVDRTPALRIAYDLANHPDVREIYIQAPTQSGKTLFYTSLICYHCHIDPASSMIIHPSRTAVEEYSKDKFGTVLENSPDLAKISTPVKSRDSSNTIFKRTFLGARVDLGSPTASFLSGKTKRVAVYDEIDKFEDGVGREGDIKALGDRRQEVFEHTRKTVVCSTPAGTEEESKIFQLVNSSVTRRYKFYPRCVHCSQLNEPDFFKSMRWDKEDPRTARFICEHCDQPITDNERFHWLDQGESVCRNPDVGYENIGIIMNGLSNPFMSFKKLVKSWLECGNNLEKIRTFFQSILAEPFEENQETIDVNDLYARREKYPAEVPEKVKCLTLAADVQKDRIELEVLGHVGDHGETYAISYKIIRSHGKITIENEHFWAKLEEQIRRRFQHELGFSMGVDICVIDSGSFTDLVYQFCKKMRAKGLKVFAIKGNSLKSASIVHRVEKNRKHKWSPKEVLSVGVHQAKNQVYRMLCVTKPGDKAAYCHFPDLPEYDREYFDQLTAETLVPVRNGRVVSFVWQKKKENAPNEVWDIRVYNTFAIHFLAPSWSFLRERIKRWQRELAKEGAVVENVSKPKPYRGRINTKSWGGKYGRS